MPVGDLAPEIALLLSAAAVLLAASFLPHRRHGWAAPLSLLGLAVVAVLSLRQGEGPPRMTFHGTWALDEATVAARLLIVGVAALAVALSPDWMRRDKRHGEYYAVLLLATLGATLLAGAGDTLELVVAVLLSSVTGYTLAAYHRGWPLSVEAGMKYFLVGALANALLVTGVALLFGVVGDTGYGATARFLTAAAAGGEGASGLGVGGAAELGGGAGRVAAAAADMARSVGSAGAGGLLEGLVADPRAVFPAVALVLVGLAFKIGAFPAHAWMPDVAEGAPVPAAAFLTVAPKIGGVVALARFVDLLPPDLVPWRLLVALLAFATMTLGNLAALGQDDVRRLIGWSSVSQSGYALMGVVVLGRSAWAVPALLVFLVGYAVANLAAFATVAELRGRTALGDYRGLGRARPAAAVVLVLAFLSLVGVPPLVGFVGKLALFTATLEGGYGWLALAAVANTVISLFYYLRVLAPVYFDEREAGSSEEAPDPAAQDEVAQDDADPFALLGAWSRATMLTAGLLVLALGLAAGVLLPALEVGMLLP